MHESEGASHVGRLPKATKRSHLLLHSLWVALASPQHLRNILVLLSSVLQHPGPRRLSPRRGEAAHSRALHPLRRLWPERLSLAASSARNGRRACSRPQMPAGCRQRAVRRRGQPCCQHSALYIVDSQAAGRGGPERRKRFPICAADTRQYRACDLWWVTIALPSSRCLNFSPSHRVLCVGRYRWCRCL